MSSIMLEKFREEGGGGGDVCFSFREARGSRAALLSTGLSVPVFWCTTFSFSSCQMCSVFCPFQLLFLYGMYFTSLCQVLYEISLMHKVQRAFKTSSARTIQGALISPSLSRSPFLGSAVRPEDPTGRANVMGEGSRRANRKGRIPISQPLRVCSAGQVGGSRWGLQRGLELDWWNGIRPKMNKRADLVSDSGGSSVYPGWSE